jgi:hypothetical protein
MADFPAVSFSSLELSSNTPTIVTTSINGLENRTQVSTQYWSFTADFQNVSDNERRQILGFLMKRRGNLNPFTIDLPDVINDSSSGFTGTITAITASAGVTTVTATTSASGVTALKAGDFFKFGNHNKVYMATDDAVASGTSVTINFFPALRTAQSSGSLTHNNVPLYVRCTNDQFTFATDPNLFGSFSIDFVEVIQ